MLATVDASAEIKSGIHPTSSNRFFSFVRFDTRAISKYENPLVRSQISPDQLLDSVTRIGSNVANGSVNGCLSPSGISVGDGTIAGERAPPSNARQRALSTYPRTDLPLDRLRCQMGHSSRRDHCPECQKELAESLDTVSPNDGN
jgi:hypothetical protein